jgi:hypothetical protein
MTAISRLTASEAYVSALWLSESAVTPGAAIDRLVIAADSRMPRITPQCSRPYGRPPYRAQRGREARCGRVEPC